MPKAKHTQQLNIAEIEPISKLWLLRILVKLGGHACLLNSYGFEDESLALALGLGYWVDPEQYAPPVFRKGKGRSPASEGFDIKAVLQDLKAAHAYAERRDFHARVPTRLAANIDKLSALAGLSATDRRILEFAVMLHGDRKLVDAADGLGCLNSTKVCQVLATILGLQEADVRASLSSRGVLARSGLLALDRSGSYQLSSKLSLLSYAFADVIATADDEPIHLLRGTVSAASKGHLSLVDYDHIRQSLDLLRPYLRQAQASSQSGVNILVHGVPGTGKSQLARALAMDLGCELYEVASEDADGDPINGAHRLRAFRAAQTFLERQKALIVFDEVEDVFNDGDGSFTGRSTAQTHKAWVNRILEENPVPALWLSNTITGLDPAFIRRFDMVFELTVPPQLQRERILHASCSDLVDAKCISRIARAKDLAPAVVAKASSVVRAIQDEIGREHNAAAFERLISNTLTAQGHQPIAAQCLGTLPELYDPRFVRADADLLVVADGLVRAGSGRLCLNGPPGTGKTAYGYWLAQKMGVPLVIKRASDLMSMWVGGNEKNIAGAFQEAQDCGGLLLIDEVDSFLQDRRAAHRSWEVSLVNEMLTQMEAFQGVFVASTNLVDGLDQASLRRFDLKVRFDFLQTAQATELFRLYCKKLDLPEPDVDAALHIARLPNLTPGDFAAVARQHRFNPFGSSKMLACALERECRMKENSGVSIGFV